LPCSMPWAHCRSSVTKNVEILKLKNHV
jgi:hypothetical protein